MITSILLVAVLSHSALAYDRSGGTAADYAAIEAVGEVWIEAYNQQNIEGILDVYTEDALVMARGRPTRRGHDDMRAAFAALMGKYTAGIRIDMEELIVYGDLAHSVATFHLTYEPTDGGDVINESGRALIIYQRGDDGAWRIWRDMDNTLPE